MNSRAHSCYRQVMPCGCDFPRAILVASLNAVPRYAPAFLSVRGWPGTDQVWLRRGNAAQDYAGPAIVGGRNLEVRKGKEGKVGQTL